MLYEGMLYFNINCFQDSDLRSALLLEQAAHCFIKDEASNGPKILLPYDTGWPQVQ